MSIVKQAKPPGILLLLVAACLHVTTPACAVTNDQASTLIEDLSTSELRERVAAGTTTILIPIGGTEQSGPYIALGKHNVRAKILTKQIAQRLGNAVVAPVVSYVPEGAIQPPVGHMRFSGTISIPEAAFESLLEATARSFKQHGFHDVVFLGDHGGYQKNLEHVAARLNKEWANDPGCRAHALLEYYRVTQTAFVDDLRHQGFSDAEIGTHAGLADTALTLAIDKSLVRSEAMAKAAKPGERDGVFGDPRRATAELGQRGLDKIIDTSVNAIRKLVQQHTESIKARR